MSFLTFNHVLDEEEQMISMDGWEKYLIIIKENKIKFPFLRTRKIKREKL